MPGLTACPQSGHAHLVSKRPTFLILNLGLSHNLVYGVPEGDVTLNVGQGSNQSSTARTGLAETPGGGGATLLGGSRRPTISIFGISRSTVNQVAASIARHKKPCHYSGKGIRYDGEKFSAHAKKDGEKKS